MAEPVGRELLNPETLAALKSLRMRPGAMREGLLVGLHRSPVKGSSVEFAEHREYAPGDDLRRVDWKVLGRTDKTYVKQYEDETNLVGTILVDASESMAYSSGRAGAEQSLTKMDYAKRLAATLAWLLTSRQDAMAVWTFDGASRGGLRAAAGPRQLDAALRLLAQTVPRGDTNFATALTELSSRLGKRCIVIVISDLFDDPAAILAGIGRLTVRRQTVHVVRVLDVAEWTFPFEQPTKFRGLEGEPELFTDPRSLRGAYLAELALHAEALNRGLGALSVVSHLALTDEPLVPLIRRIVQARPDAVTMPRAVGERLPAGQSRSTRTARSWWRTLIGS